MGLEGMELGVGRKEALDEGEKKMKGGGVVMNPGIVEKKTERVECGKRRGGSEEGDEWFEIGYCGEMMKRNRREMRKSGEKGVNGLGQFGVEGEMGDTSRGWIEEGD